MTMETHSLERLEFPKLLQILAEGCQSQPGRERLLRFRPHAKLERIREFHAAYREAMDLQRLAYELPPLDFDDILPLLKRAEPEGAVLAGEELLQILVLLDCTADLGDAILDPEAPCPALKELARRLDPCLEWRRRLRCAISMDGMLLDDASPLLAQLRHRLGQLGHEIRQRLETLSKGEEWETALQEDFVTERNGRLVVPVRREEKSRLPGVVHDLSNSGRTLFIEPLQTLPLGNELADLRLQERDECRRILAELTAGARERLEPLRRNQWLLSVFDTILAISRHAAATAAELPQFGDTLRLRRARHPLLEHQFQGSGKTVVPLTLELPDKVRALVVTGSNTGGKTVALKTVGLLTLMAQSGLPVPAAADSQFVVYDQVFADIGDEQSLEANLSTFSAHIETMKHFLDNSRRRHCLVLLDELGAGTDPVEGGALACALLEEFARRPGLTLATTHLGAVKLFVHNRPEMLNGAVRFNEQTLAPEYALDIGRPGASHALEIARRLGLPEPLVAQAQRLMGRDQLRLEEILLGLEKERRQAEEHRQELEQARQEAEQARTAAREELEQLRRHRRDNLHEAYEKAESLVANTRRQVERLQLQLSQAGTTPDETRKKQAFQEARQELQGKAEKLNTALQQTRPRPSQPVAPAELVPGRKVWIEKLRATGKVLEVSDDGRTALLDVDGLRFSMKTQELGRAPAGGEKEEKRSGSVIVARPLYTKEVRIELNVVGRTVDEALPLVADFVSDALLAGLEEIRIVHGFGTGRLRQGVQEWLSHRQGVANYRLGIHGQDPGGAGATIVTLARQ